MKKPLHTFMICAALSSIAALASAAPITIIASDDNYVYDRSGSTNDAPYNGVPYRDMNFTPDAVRITVKNASSSDRIGYVKFDLTSVISGIDTSQDATLNLTFDEMGNGGSGDTAEFVISALSNSSPSNSNWEEDSITYNTRPTGTFVDLNPSYNWSFNSSNDLYTVTVSNLSNFIQTDNTVTFRIFGPQLPDTGNNPYWHSSEATNVDYRPSLVVIPEASTLGLMAVGMMALFGVSRRRKAVA